MFYIVNTNIPGYTKIIKEAGIVWVTNKKAFAFTFTLSRKVRNLSPLILLSRTLWYANLTKLRPLSLGYSACMLLLADFARINHGEALCILTHTFVKIRKCISRTQWYANLIKLRPFSLGYSVFFPHKALVCRCSRILRGVTMGRAFAFTLTLSWKVRVVKDLIAAGCLSPFEKLLLQLCILCAKNNLVFKKMWQFYCTIGQCCQKNHHWCVKG